MKQLTKSCGFTRTPDQDFTDDGAKFTTYRFGDYVRITRCRHENDVYICADIDYGRTRPWDPKYRYNTWKLMREERYKYNGVNVNVFDRDDFIRICKELDELFHKPDEQLFEMLDKLGLQ